MKQVSGARRGPRILESGVLNEIRTALGYQGWFVVRIQQGLGCYKGMTDLVATKNGVTLFIECKVPGGKQSVYQVEFQRRLEQVGGNYVLATSYSDVEKYVKGLF